MCSAANKLERVTHGMRLCVPTGVYMCVGVCPVLCGSQLLRACIELCDAVISTVCCTACVEVIHQVSVHSVISAMQ